MQGILTSRLAHEAIALTLPSIDAAIKSKKLSRPHCHIVVSNPLYKGPIEVGPWCEDGGILAEHSVGDPVQWEKPFENIARSKCFLSVQTGLPTQLIQQRYPYLLSVGDTVYYGSVVENGLAVAVSGFKPYFDEAIAACIVALCRALSIAERERMDMVETDGFVTGD